MHTTVNMLKTALASSRTLRRWSQDHYGKAPSPCARAWEHACRPPDESDASIHRQFPGCRHHRAGRKANEHEVGLLIGLSEEGFETRRRHAHDRGRLARRSLGSWSGKPLNRLPGVSLGMFHEYHLLAIL